MKQIDQLLLTNSQTPKRYKSSSFDYQDIVSDDMIDLIIEKMGFNKSERDFIVRFEHDIGPGRYNYVNQIITIDVSQLKSLTYSQHFTWMRNKLYAALIHEIQHWAQHKHGWLTIDNKERKIIWKGTPYNPPWTGSPAYFSAPWEVDANKVSEKITNELINEGLIYPDAKETTKPAASYTVPYAYYNYRPILTKETISPKSDEYKYDYADYTRSTDRFRAAYQTITRKTSIINDSDV